MPASLPLATPAVRADYLAFGRPDFTDDEVAAVARVLRSGWVGMGPEVIAFEQELAAYLGAPHVVTVSSCTAALHLALLVHGVGPGDEVIVPSLTWCSTANAALYLGARPVFCDVDPVTLCLTPATVAAVLTPRTRAVIPVHFGGLAIDLSALRAALPPTVAIIEDAAHALGARYPDGRNVGSSGHAACFSFYANKNLSTGEGGAIALADAALADRLRSLRQHGMPIDAWKRFTHPHAILVSKQLSELGFKMNYTDLQACLGRVQLRRFGPMQARRCEVIERYRQRLAGTVQFQAGAFAPGHARHLAVVLLPLERMSLTRAQLLEQLRARQVGATIHYSPLHRMPLYLAPGAAPAPLPATDHAADHVLTLPIGAAMTVRDADYVADHFLAALHS